MVSAVTGSSGKKANHFASRPDAPWIFYDLERDPHELKPVPPEELKSEARALMGVIKALLEQRALDSDKKGIEYDLSERELKQLRELGY